MKLDDIVNSSPNTATNLIQQIRIGNLQSLGPLQAPSGIYKQAVQGTIALTLNGLIGDEHGDTQHHGGPEKALHHYPSVYYAAWAKEYPHRQTLFEIGAFGENLVSTGITERDVCIGDVYALGTSVIQVSQGRQPCVRLNWRFGLDGMAKRVQQTGRTGWYYRVLSTGQVTAGDMLELLERPNSNWSVSKVLHYLHVEMFNEEALSQIAELTLLAPNWRNLARKRLASHKIEDMTKRLGENIHIN